FVGRLHLLNRPTTNGGHAARLGARGGAAERDRHHRRRSGVLHVPETPRPDDDHGDEQSMRDHRGRDHAIAPRRVVPAVAKDVCALRHLSLAWGPTPTPDALAPWRSRVSRTGRHSVPTPA